MVKLGCGAGCFSLASKRKPLTMVYSVKEMFYTLQGEGAQAGRPSVFIRFSGCNLWTGREQDRKNAVCSFCDTDFVGTDGIGGGKFSTPETVVQAVLALWPVPVSQIAPYIVCTGGEPLLQLDLPLIHAMKKAGFIIALETNGTKPVPEGIDWICVSPKGQSEIIHITGHELKLVYPQPDAMPERFSVEKGYDFQHFYLQPMDNLHRQENTQAAIAYCLEHPWWKLSLQTHKILDIP
jgi:7-carboxy-7-deazaguanine synthase